MYTFSRYAIVSFIFALGIIKVQGQDAQTPKSYIAYKTDEAVMIDGRANDPAWSQVDFSSLFIDIEGIKKPKYDTRVKMLWDENNLYVYAYMQEPHVWATLKQRDTVIFYNNDFEIFIDPDGDTHNYYELEVNALNTVWDLFLGKPYRESAPVIDSWDIQELQSAVAIDGSLNDPADIDKGWSVEIAIPWSVLVEASDSNSLPINDFWRINFSRVNWDHTVNKQTYSRKKDSTGTFMPEYNWVWSPQGVINMHEPEHWGYVYFSSKLAGEKDSFRIPDDEYIKWELYRIYRAQKKYKNTHGAYAKSLRILDMSKILVKNKTLFPKLELHTLGYTIHVKSPFTNKKYYITHDGKLIAKD